MKILGILVLFLSGSYAYAQTDVLNELIKLGLDRNLALRQQSLALEQGISALKQARGLFFPSLSIQARYSRAGGGRKIEFPVGTLLNPVYQSLNELYVAAGRPPLPFPTLENEVIPFLRKEEHETKIRLVQPVIQPAIYFNYRLQSKLTALKEADLVIFKRELIRDIQQAYFKYLSTIKILDLYKKTKTVLEENLRVSQSLFEVNKVTKDVVYRAQSELSALEEEVINAENQKVLAQSYLNFLLNRALETEITPDDQINSTMFSLYDYKTYEHNALQNREELEQLNLGRSVAKNQKSVAYSSYLPTVNAVLDYGFEGDNYRFSDKDDFWMASLILEWNLFNGFQDQAKLEQAQLEIQKFETQKSELAKQIKLQVQQTFNNCISALQQIEVAEDRKRFATATFEIIQKKYEEGLVAQIEFLDARQNLTASEINAVLALYNYFQNFAQLERDTAMRLIEHTHD